jgi:RNA polymerase sigma-70 factor (ECF subfamily)
LPDNILHNEKELLRNIAEGDERAFFTFYDHYSGLLRPFLRKYTQTGADIEEVIQETFMKVWINRDRLPEVEQPKSWLYKIASRTFLNYAGKLANERKNVLQAVVSAATTESITPFEKTAIKEIQKTIQLAVGRLTEQKKRVFTMSRDQGLKPAEIAQKLGMPVGTVKNQLSAALKDIRDQLIAAGHGPILILYIMIRIF